MATAKIEPHMVMADAQGNIYDDPDLLMVCRRGEEWGTPRPDELMPLPEESELFLLPGRRAVGLNPGTGEIERTEDLAVAAFAAPAHTLSAHPAYTSDADAPLLPLFAYGAVGFAKGRFYICARKVDADQRQEFRHIPRSRIEKNVRALLRRSAGRADPIIERGALRISPATREVTFNGEPVILSSKEYALLAALAERQGVVWSRSQLEEKLYNWDNTVGSNAIEVHIHHLRKKLSDNAIKTVRGVGYLLET